jgi:hypothetical protein
MDFLPPSLEKPERLSNRFSQTMRLAEASIWTFDGIWDKNTDSEVDQAG